MDFPNTGLQAWRIYNSSGTALFAQDTDGNSLSVDTDYQIRFQIDNSGIVDEATTIFALEADLNAVGFLPVTTVSSIVQATTAGLTDTTATTNVLTGGQATFVAGEESTDGIPATLILTATSQTEMVFGITIISGDVVDLDTIDFRIAGAADFETVATTIIVSEAGGGFQATWASQANVIIGQ